MAMSEQIESVREKIIDILRRNGVKRASFFGSIIKVEMTEESDVDLLVESEGRRSGGCCGEERRSADLQIAPSSPQRDNSG